MAIGAPIVTQVETRAPYAAGIVGDYRRYTAGTAMLETADRLLSLDFRTEGESGHEKNGSADAHEYVSTPGVLLRGNVRLLRRLFSARRGEIRLIPVAERADARVRIDPAVAADAPLLLGHRLAIVQRAYRQRMRLSEPFCQTAIDPSAMANAPGHGFRNAL